MDLITLVNVFCIVDKPNGRVQLVYDDFLLESEKTVVPPHYRYVEVC